MLSSSSAISHNQRLETESPIWAQRPLRHRPRSIMTTSARNPRTTTFNDSYNESFDKSSLNYPSDGSFDEARYNLATRIMSNGVEVIIAGDKSKATESTATPWQKSTQIDRPMTLAPSTLKNQMILAIPSKMQENFTLPINSNQFITKTCLTTYTYRTTYLENGKTTVDSREKVISNIATEERNYLRMSSVLPLGVTLTRTPELVVGVFPTTYFYYNTIRDDTQPIVITSAYTVSNTITGPDDYIGFLQPSEEATPTQDTNTYYSRITLTKTIRSDDITQIVSTENILTQVIVTESYPARSTSILTSYYAYDTDESSVVRSDIQPTQPVIVTYMHTYTNEKGLARVETILKTLQKSSTSLVKQSTIENLNDVHIFATKTFLTTFTYYTTKSPMASLSTQIEGGALDATEPITPDYGFRTHVIENVVTDTVPSYLLRPELVSKFQTELMQKKGKNQRRVIVTVATLIGGQTLEITAMKMIRPAATRNITISPTTSATTTILQFPTAEASTPILNVQSTVLATNQPPSKTPNVKVANEKLNNLNENQETVSDNDTSFAESEDAAVYAALPPPTSDNLELDANLAGTHNKVVENLPTAVNQIFSSFNFQRLRPMINAVADLLQTNLKSNRPNQQSDQKTQRLVESKNALQNLTEHPIYIPVQSGIQDAAFRPTDFNNNNNLAEQYKNGINDDIKLSPHSLHITPPDSDIAELSNDDNWLREPSSAITDYKTALINGGIAIRPGEVITANSDVIIGRPNGIQFPRIPLHSVTEFQSNANSQQTIDSNLNTRQQQQQQQQLADTKVSFYQQAIQHPLRKKSSPSVTPNVIPLVAPYPANVRLKEYTRQPFNENYDQILKPPPPPPTLLYPSTTLKYKHQKPIHRNMYRIKNEIIEIKPIPEVFTTNIPALVTSTYWLDSTPQRTIQKYDFKTSPSPNPTPLTKLDFKLNTSTKDSATYAAHQHISLKTDVLNHNVAMNVPPLTFNKETEDYPPAQAIHGHIAPDAGHYQPAMPQVQISPNELQVNVNLTPQAGLGSITTPNTNLEKPFNQHMSQHQQPQHDATAIGSFAVDLNKTYKTAANSQKQSLLSTQSSHATSPAFNYYSPFINKNKEQTTKATTTTTAINQSTKPFLNADYLTRQHYLDAYSDEEASIFSHDQKAAETINSFFSTNLSTLLMHQSVPKPQVNRNTKPNLIPLKITTNPNSYTYSKVTVAMDTDTDDSRLTTVYPKFQGTLNKQLDGIYDKASSLPIVDGSPFVINPNMLDKPKNQSLPTNSGLKNIFIASGEGFKINQKTQPKSKPQREPIAGTPIIAFSGEKTASVYQNEIPKRNEALTTTLGTTGTAESKRYSVLGLSPPPPPSMTPTTVQYSTLNYVNKSINTNLTDELNFKAKTKSKQVFDQASFLKPPPPPPSPNSHMTSREPTFSITKLQSNKTVSKPYTSLLPTESNLSAPLALSTKSKSKDTTRAAIVITPSLTYNLHDALINPTRRLLPKLQATVTPFALNTAETSTAHMTFATQMLLQPSEISTKTSTQSTKQLSNTFIQPAVTSNTTTNKRLIKTLKRIVLPTKYITNTKILTVITTKTTVLIKTLQTQPVASATFDPTSVNLKTGIVPSPPTSTYLVTKTHTILDTVTEIYTTTVVQETTATTTKLATTYLNTSVGFTKTISANTSGTSSIEKRKPTVNATPGSHHYDIQTAIIRTETGFDATAISQQDNSPTTTTTADHNNNADAHLAGLKDVISGEPLDYNEAQPSVEIVYNDNQLRQQEQEQQQQKKMSTISTADPDQSSIFIVMTNNNLNKANEATTDTKLHSKLFEFNDDAHQSLDVAVDYDTSISFELPSRDEESSPLDANSGRQVLLGGVLIASQQPKITTNSQANGRSIICQPQCKSTRNEVCAIVGPRTHCVCRPGFARMFPDRPCKPTYTFKMSIQTDHIGNYQLKFTAPLKNNASNEYRHLSSIILDAVDRMVMQSDFRDVYHGVQLIKFEQQQDGNNVLAEFLLQLSDNSDEKRLQSVLKKYLRQSNYSIGGTELYTSNQGMQYLGIEDFNECANNKFHDCSSYAQCFNLQGTYTCSCLDGYADMSPNTIYPGRICSEELVGCEKCHYNGNCQTSQPNPEVTVCECFPWHTGASCQVNLKILLISMIAVGTLLFILLLFCLLLAYMKRRKHRNSAANSQIFIASSLHPSMLSTPKKSRISKSIMKTTDMHSRTDKHAMIQDTSSESSQNSLPYVLKYKEPHTNIKTYGRTGQLHKTNNAASRLSKSNNTHLSYGAIETDLYDMDDGADLLAAATHPQKHSDFDQTDRSLTVMIPRAKYHPSVVPPKYLMHHQLTLEREETVSKVEGIVAGVTPSHLAAQISNPVEKTRGNVKAKVLKKSPNIKNYMPTSGALVSAGFEVSAIVNDLVAVMNKTNDSFNITDKSSSSIEQMLSTAETTATMNVLRSSDSDNNALRDTFDIANKELSSTSDNIDLDSYKRAQQKMDSMWISSNQKSVSAEARSLDETTVLAATTPIQFSIETQTYNTNDEANTMAERDVGSTFLLPHTHLYEPEKESVVSEFDSI